MKTVKEIFLDEKAPVIALIAAVTKEYSSDCYEWEPMVLKAELQEDHDCEISDLQSDKIQAGITLLTTDHYENNIVMFENINHFINNQHDSIDEFNPLEAEELVVGLTEAYLVKGEEMHFSPEVRVYAGYIFREYGFHKPPTLFPQAIMEERDGDDTEKNAALQELFDEKIRITKEYLK